LQISSLFSLFCYILHIAQARILFSADFSQFFIISFLKFHEII